MKKAIKVLEKRIKLLNKELGVKDVKFGNCEMVSDYEFLKTDLTNIKLEVIELKKAIKLINDNI